MQLGNEKAPLMVFMAALILLLSSSAFAEVLFAPNVNYSTDPYPHSMVKGDYNGDGKLDLVTANMWNLSVLLGKGDGTFLPKSNLLVGGYQSRPQYITTGDFNNDGKLDLASVNYTYNYGKWDDEPTMSILLGNGDGTFQIPIFYWIRDFYYGQITTGDFNGDGKLDLARANILSSGITIYLGNGDGTFQESIHLETGPLKVRKVITADINGDGHVDIVTGNFGYGANYGYYGTVSVLLGNGDGTFQASKELRAGEWVHSVVAVDLNNDGKLDLAATSIGMASVFIGNGDGTFQTRQDNAIGGTRGAGDITAEDLDGDGKLDLATAYSGVVSVLLGNGNGTFQTKSDFIWPTYTISGYLALATGDFNLDGKVDLAATGDRYHAVSIFINTTPNRPPIAKAGSDQVIECAGPFGTSVILDGSASSDPDGDALTYTWNWAGGSAVSMHPSVELPLGTTSITLTVSDGKASSTATVNITVRDTTLPQTTTTGDSMNWYNSNVISTLSSSDNCSGVKEIHYSVNGFDAITTGGYASAIITAEGLSNIIYYAIDNKDNVESPKSMNIKIDKTPPSTSAKIDATLGDNGWYKSDVQVVLSATDNGSGVAKTEYSFNGTDWMTYVSALIINTEGITNISYRSTDNAGNIETVKTLTVKIDRTNPTLNLAPSQSILWSPNRKLVDVMVNGSAADVTSGIASLVITVADEYGVYNMTVPGFGSTIQLEAWRDGNDMDGRHYTMTVNATDMAGNTSTATTEVVVPHDVRH